MSKLEGEFHFSSGGTDRSDASDKSPGAAEKDAAEAEGSLPPPHTDEAKAEHVPVKQRVHFYTSLGEYPKGVSFDSQDSDEEIILLIRRSFLTNVPWIAAVVLLALLPPILLFLPLPTFFEGVTTLTYVIGFIFYYLILFGAVLVNFSLWYFHVGLLTNKRVIDVDLHGILSRHVSETRLSLIQDVSYQQVGFVRSLFHFGDVFVQTAGSEQNIEFDRIPRPIFVAQVVGDLLGRPYHKKGE